MKPLRRLGPALPGGFSLIELLGLLAIMAVLVLAVAPMLMSELDRASLMKEEANLRRLAAGFEDSVVRHRTIPGASGWVEAVATEIGESTAWVALNPRGEPRVLWVDPRFGVGPAGSDQPPFAQTPAGSSRVTNPRLVIFSSMGAGLPAGVLNVAAATEAQFDELWNLVEGRTPASWSWSGSGSDLKVQRLDLTPLFHQVTMNSMDTLPGRYSVDDASPVEVPREPITFFLLRGSVVGLQGTDSVAQSREVMDRACSFSFEAGIWRGLLFAGIAAPTLSGSEMEAVASSFLAAPANPDATSTPAQVYAAVQDYMSSYNNWALAGYPSSGPLKDAVILQQASLETAVRDLSNP